MKNTIRIFLIFVVVLAVGSCATIIKGGSADVSIDSEPSGAEVVIYDHEGTEIWTSATPTVAELDRSTGFFQGASYTVEIQHDGYETATVEITSGVNGWYIAGNIVFGGLIGWLVVDPLTGAMFNLRPDEISADLAQSVGVDYNNGDMALTVVLISDIPASQRETLDRIELEG